MDIKTTYIVYRILDEKIELFASHKAYWTGLALTESHPAITEIGTTLVFEGVDSTEPVERIVFATYSLPERLPYPAHLMSKPMFFSLKSTSSVHKGVLQDDIFRFVTLAVPFAGKIVFLDKRRNIVKDIFHAPV